MKTLAIETNDFTGFRSARALAPSFPAVRPPREWLPAPPITIRRKAQPVRRASSFRSIWMSAGEQSVGEKLVYGVVVIAALAGVGYAFSGLLDVVHNWAAFNGWVAQILP
jgi:hypothetical protein